MQIWLEREGSAKHINQIEVVFADEMSKQLTNKSPFDAIIHSYSRKQFIADEIQVDVTKTAQEAGIRIPVFLTRTVFDTYVAVPKGIQGQDEAGRLWDICWMLCFAILRSHSSNDRVAVGQYVRNDNCCAKLVKLIAQCAPLDPDDPQPAMTVNHFSELMLGLSFIGFMASRDDFDTVAGL